MGFVVLDTDVASLAFRRRLPPLLASKLLGKTWCVTYVTVGEMTQWAQLRSWGVRNRSSLDIWLDDLVVIHSSTECAGIWGTLSGIGKQQGRSHPINDTWIASCCLAEGLPLATLNVKDYQDFVIHHGLAVVTEE
jgi:predicted nucleic acid-binding protein